MLAKIWILIFVLIFVKILLDNLRTRNLVSEFSGCSNVATQLTSTTKINVIIFKNYESKVFLAEIKVNKNVSKHKKLTNYSYIQQLFIKKSYKKNSKSKKRRKRSFILPIGERIDLRVNFYINRKFINSSLIFDETLSSKVLDFEDLLNLKLILLSDEAGSGKTTTFRHIAQKLKEKFKLFWVSYVDLKKYVKVLPEISQLSRNSTQIAEFLATNFFNLTEKSSSKLFINSFKANRLIFLWDGIDEISPNYFNEIIHLIKLINNSTANRQWISTRNTFKRQIEEALDVKSYKLNNFDEKDREEFIKKHIKASNATIKVEDLQKEILKVIENIENFGSYENHGTYNPQFLHNICKYFINNSFELYKFYKFYISELIDFADQKGDVVKDRIKEINEQEMFRQIHQHYAIRTALSTDVNNLFHSFDNFAQHLAIKKLTVNFKVDDVARYGILVPNQFGKLEFQHEIFADYFVAQYLYQTVWKWQYEEPRDEEAQARLEFLFYVIQKGNSNFKITLDILSGFIEEGTATGTENKISEIINEIINKKFRNLLQTLGQDLSGIEFTTKFFKKDLKILKTLWKIDQNCSFFLEYFKEISHFECFFEKCIPMSSRHKTLKKLSNIVKQNFDKENILKIFAGNFQKVNKLFIIWMNRNHEKFVNDFRTLTQFNENIDEFLKVEEFSIFLELAELKFEKKDFREFLSSNLYNFLLNFKNSDLFSIYWHYLEKHFSHEEVKSLLMKIDLSLFENSKLKSKYEINLFLDFKEKFLKLYLSYN